METFIELITEALEKENEVKPNDKFREYDEWDSLAVLSVIAMIKQNFGITIPRKEFEELRSIRELYNYIIEKS